MHYRYPGGGWALKGLELILAAGDYTVVFGANGSGKSTFAYLVNGLIPHFIGGELLGDVTVDGLDTRQTNVGRLFDRVGLVLQNTDAQLFSSTVEDEIAFGLESLGLPAQAIKASIREVAAALGLERLLGRAPETLSGGERRLVAIASVLGADPPILVLDEPFSSLDWKFGERLRALLAGMHRAGKTLVVIEQASGPFLRDATRLVVMDGGRCAFSGEPAEGWQAREYARLVPRYPSRPSARASADGGPLLSVEHLGCRLGEKEILTDVSFALHPGETAAIVGENGAGKSTLVKHLNGLLRPTSGDIRLRGDSIRRHPVAELARRVGLCFQNPNDQFFKPTVREEIQAGMRRGKAPGDRCEDFCRLFRLSSLLDRPPQQLSEGEKKRVAIASVMAMDPELLVLDEPTAGQDAIAKEALAARIADISEAGKAVLVVTHDLAFAEACSRRWLLLHEGRIVADGSPGQIRSLIRPDAAEPLQNSMEPEQHHRAISPVARLAVGIMAVAAVLVSRSPAVVLCEAAVVAAAGLLRFRHRPARYVGLIWPMAVMVGVVGLLFFDPETALVLGLRVFNLLGGSLIAFSVVSPEDMGAALRQLRLPHGLVFMFTAGLRYVPLMENKIRSIRDAQQARGIDLSFRLKNARNWMAILAPLLVQSFLLADELAMAMESRGFSRPGRTCRRQTRPTWWDGAVMAAALGMLAALAYWERG